MPPNVAPGASLRRTAPREHPALPPGGIMTEPLVPPQETPPVEGSTSSAHVERPDGGVWEHPALWVSLIVFGAVLVALFFALRVLGL
ncbi:DUF6480 family protein [Streptomyces roseolus]|uniref:DUF6480 family protein n=1 Tax=Streptomyces roseolus TaxID=67358 RepID=UPI003630BCC6